MYLLSILSLFFLYSCKEEREVIPNIKSTSIDVEQAERWFNSELGSWKEIGKTNGRIPYPITRKLLWQFAQNFRLSNGIQALSIPLAYDSKSCLGKVNQSKLILFRNEQGKFDVQIMKVIGNTAFLRKNSSLQSLDEFSGVLMMYDWEENF